MTNIKNQFKSILPRIKWWKKIMLFETLLFFVITLISHYHGACTSHGWIGQMPEANFGCTNYITFFEYFGLKYFYFALILILILSIFLISTILLGKLTEKIFAKHNSYQKTFIIELWGFMIILFSIIMLFVLIYDGNSCLADNCVDVSLLTSMQWWLPDILIPLFFSPIFLGIIIVPYLAIFTHKSFKK